jgi:hypothetical protein
MIELFNSKKKLLASFETYEEIFEYIYKMALYKFTNEEFLDDDTSFYQSKWSFVTYEDKVFSDIHSEIHKTRLTKSEKIALEKNLGLIEIYYGIPTEVYQFPVTSKLDVAKLKKEWCRAYCKAHRYTLKDTNAKKINIFSCIRRTK